MNPDEIKKLEEDKAQLKRDYIKVTSEIDELLFAGRNNGAILDPDYITPTVDFRRNLSFDSVEGELWYYSDLRAILERAAGGQLIPADSVHCKKLPKYVSDLVR